MPRWLIPFVLCPTLALASPVGRDSNYNVSIVTGGGGGVVATNLGTHSAFGATGVSTITSAAAVAAGVLVVCVVDDNYIPATNGTFADSQSNTWVLGKRQFTAAQVDSEIWYSFITTPLTTSSTMTYTTVAGFSGSNTISSGCTKFTGATYSSLDAATTNGAGAFGTAYSVTGAGSAGVANELYFGLVTAQGTVTVPGGSWLTAPPTSPGAVIQAAYQINAGTSALTFNGVVASSQWVAALVSFHP